MKKWILLLAAVLALTLCACGADRAGQNNEGPLSDTQAPVTEAAVSAAPGDEEPADAHGADAPEECKGPAGGRENGELPPEECRAYYDYTELEVIAQDESELPLASDAKRGAPGYLGLWYEGNFTQMKAVGSDEGYTMAELTDGRGVKYTELGRFSWNGERYDCVHLQISDSFVPNVSSVSGGVLWLELEGDCRADDGTADGAHFNGFDTVVISGSGTLTMAQGIDCGCGELPLPALIIDGVDVICPFVSLASNSDPDNVAGLVVLSGSLTVDTLFALGDVCTAGGSLTVGTIIDCARLVCRAGTTVLTEGWGFSEENEGADTAVLLSGGDLQSNVWFDEHTECWLWKGTMSGPGFQWMPGVHVLGGGAAVEDTGEK